MKASSPKVVCVLECLAYGGLEWHAVELLPRLKARGIDVEAVVILGGGPLIKVLAERGIRVISLGLSVATIYRLDQWVPAAWRLRRYLQASSANIIHSQHYMPDVLTRLAAPRGTPIVSTVHQWEPWWDNGRRLRSRLRTRLDVTLARWRDVRVIAVSQDTANAVSRTFRLRPERLQVIYNGIDLNRFPLDQLPSLPRDASAPVMIQVGSMHHRKGQSVSIGAFPLVLKEFPNASLLFVGDGPLRGDLEAQARALGVQNKVRFLGKVKDVIPWLHASDLFWMPSRFEGFGLACAEAMACRLPTVTTNVIGLREVPVDGVTGFVVPADSPEALAAASLRILKDPALATRMGLAGRQRVVEKFSIERTADEYARAYEDIVQGRWK
ncbi:MAG: glycosyltransferase family 4 protein [Terriglobia bacterium]|jgi:glycosyltransferase involved in cell wall biosynthesis